MDERFRIAKKINQKMNLLTPDQQKNTTVYVIPHNKLGKFHGKTFNLEKFIRREQQRNKQNVTTLKNKQDSLVKGEKKGGMKKESTLQADFELMVEKEEPKPLPS